MPISASAKKALRSSERKASINRYRKRLIKAALKEVSADSVTQAVSLIDKAVKWQIFHPNKAARLKSRLSKDFPIKAGEAKPTKPKATKKVTKTTAEKPKTVKKAPAKATSKTSAKKPATTKKAKS